MFKRMTYALLIVALSGVGVTAALSLRGWTFDPTDVEIVPTQDGAARVLEIEPISLLCAARVHAEVPLTIRREHSALGQVYRTDTLEMVAIGDVDTCVQTHEVSHRVDNGVLVIEIPGSAIVYERPRVDAPRTEASVRVDKGLIGKVTDSAFWVSDDLGLTPVAYSYAQAVIGGSCAAAAREVTEGLVRDAYLAQVASQGVSLDMVRVEVGESDPQFELPFLGDGLSVDDWGQSARCEIALPTP